MGGKDAGTWMDSAQAPQPSSPCDSVLDMPAASATAVDMDSQKQLEAGRLSALVIGSFALPCLLIEDNQFGQRGFGEDTVVQGVT